MGVVVVIVVVSVFMWLVLALESWQKQECPFPDKWSPLRTVSRKKLRENWLTQA